MLYNQLKIARRQVQELKSNAVETVEAEIIEENFHLKSEVNALKIKLAEKNGSDGKSRVWRLTGGLSLIILFLAFYWIVNTT